MAVIEDCWFQAMQDEIHEFDRLEVWELVPRPIYVMVIALKWIYKVKLDEYGDMSLSVSEGFEDQENPTHVYRKKARFNGLQQAQGRGLQVFSKSLRHLINQGKICLKTLRNMDWNSLDPVDTPMVIDMKLDEDLMGIPVDANSI
ncbi:retrovirus-related pol polyprotein from transposon TNT 1-94 [Tanacetum coccineum]|uniref:Retrovirus-related pol polyprotein from transposon TNT 1-94 n=1 Tax=Tanacetum coccineum TaxID=301880 RepID=A0ABQ4Y6Q4_9ASTR